jgi:branched-chain amino acid transport system ATP-binding protein
MLNISSLRVYHGPIEALHGVDISVAEKQCVTLLGPNGAGKTSTLSAITGTARATGKIKFIGQDILSDSIEMRKRKGIAISPEGRRIFSNLTVKENLSMGAAIRKDSVTVAAEIENWFEHFPILGERHDQPAGTLSGGEQQMLAIARALLSKPKILLLDEPSLGLAPQITTKIYEIIKELKKQGTTILLVEQNANAAMAVSDYVYVLNNGLVSSHGPAEKFGDGSALMDELTGVRS